jgi:hypothetical protein
LLIWLTSAGTKTNNDSNTTTGPSSIVASLILAIDLGKNKSGEEKGRENLPQERAQSSSKSSSYLSWLRRIRVRRFELVFFWDNLASTTMIRGEASALRKHGHGLHERFRKKVK